MPDNSPPTRRARLERDRRVHRTMAGVGAVILAVAGVLAFVAWRDTSSSADAAHEPNSIPVNEAVVGPQSTVATAPGRTRILTHDSPLRVWVGGDSLSGELGPALGEMLGSTGVVQVNVDFKVGSGLHDNGLRNWPRQAPLQMTQHKPDVAVFMIGANDASIVGGNTSSWAPGYRAKVATMMDLLGGADHRPVIWVGPPTMGSASLDSGAKALAALMADEATKHKNVTYVDAYKLFSGPNGGYTNYLDISAMATSRGLIVHVNGDLTNVYVRIGDGVHFSASGADWMAFNVAKLLDTRWHIVRQAGGTPIQVSIEDGGGSIPGYRPRRPTTNSWQSPSSSVATSTTSVVVPSTSATTLVPPSTTTATPSTVVETTTSSTPPST